MKTLYDMMLDAQNGAVASNLSRQFGISERQALYAVEAMMPAFSASLKRNTETPDGMAQFMGALMSGRHAQYYEDPLAAFGFGQDDGRDILGHMFGSKEVSRAVAAQASQATGIGQDILKQMLPVIASMVMGGLFKQSANTNPFGGSSGGIFGDILNEMMGGGQSAGRARTTRRGSNPFEGIMDDILSNAARSRRKAPGRSASPLPGDSNPFDEIMGEALNNPRRRSKAQSPTTAKVPTGQDVFGDMFEAGREVQAGYQKSMEDLMDQFLSGMGRS